MALYMTAWDIPTDEALLNEYNVKSKEWVAMIMRQPGVKEFRAYRDPLRNSPDVMVHIEFDSLESVIKYLKSDDCNKATSEMIELGCSGFVNEMWDASPLVPEPIRP